MSDWIKVVVQGMVQGLTEFVPISSTGHLLVVGALLDFGENMEGTFEIVIQMGTLLAIIFFFRQALWAQFISVRSEPTVRKFWLNIVIGSIPISVAGFLFVDFITSTLFAEDRRMVVVAIMLIVGGLIFLWVENYIIRTEAAEGCCKDKGIYQITAKQALIVGIAQTFALIPGTSRSGASIVGGLLAGLDRETATTFSFYLAIPALGGATLITLLTSLDELESQQLGFLILGGLVAGLSGWLIIAWLLRYVAHHNFIVFGYYRIIVGFALLMLVVSGLM